MSQNERVSGYLDVKISSKSRRGFTPWKAWQRQWCEIRRLDDIENGVELKLRTSEDGNILNRVLLPRSATICRTESRTKHYSFGVFNLGRNKKPILFLSGSSECDSQEWMFSIRKMLSIASYIPVGESNYRVSLVDNTHSRTAGLLGMFGVLNVNKQELIINDPCTGDPKIIWKWFQFHQFHLQAPAQVVDDKKIVVMHTSGEFPAGPGQLYLYCRNSPSLLRRLTSRGRPLSKCSSGPVCERLSRSEGDLRVAPKVYTPESPQCFRSHTGSEDSGVRVSSLTSDEGDCPVKHKNASSSISVGMAMVTKTPGGSETEDSSQDLASNDSKTGLIPRNESGISLASGIYEEIDEEDDRKLSNSNHLSHVYENPVDIILDNKNKFFTPPPLPPRRIVFFNGRTRNLPEDDYLPISFTSQFKQRCNTLPAKDLSKISQIFTSDSEYVVMSPSTKSTEKSSVSESFYMPMSPIIHLKTKLENCIKRT